LIELRFEILCTDEKNSSQYWQICEAKQMTKEKFPPDRAWRLLIIRMAGR
jgi:hypothetical protein